MNRLRFTVWLILQISVGLQLFPQITLLQSFPYSGTYVQLETGGGKFFLMDVPESECRIYDLNHLLWKTVRLEVPANHWLADIQYVSQHLFNTDDQLEMLYVYYEYVETATSYYYVYTTRVAGENGQVFLDVPGGSFAEIKAVSPTESRLLVYVWDYSVYPYTVETKIYRLPGMVSGVDPLPPDAAGAKDPAAYPNPSSGRINIPFPAQMNQNKADLLLMNDSGQVIFRRPVTGPVKDLDIRQLGLASGIYYYKLESPYYQTKPSKIVYTR